MPFPVLGDAGVDTVRKQNRAAAGDKTPTRHDDIATQTSRFPLAKILGKGYNEAVVRLRCVGSADTRAGSRGAPTPLGHRTILILFSQTM